MAELKTKPKTEPRPAQPQPQKSPQQQIQEKRAQITKEFLLASQQIKPKLIEFQQSLHQQKQRMIEQLHLYKLILEEQRVEELNQVYKDANEILERYVIYQQQVISDLENSECRYSKGNDEWREIQYNVNAQAFQLQELLNRGGLVQKMVKVQADCYRVEAMLEEFDNQNS